MDWVIWTIAGIFLIGIIVGVYRGALRIAVSIVTAVVTIIITVFVTPYVAQIVEEKTPLDESMKKSVTESMIDVAETLFPAEEEAQSEGEADEGEANADVENADAGEIPRDIQIKAIETADLPAVFKDLLAENNNDEIYSELGVETFAEYAGTYLAKLSIRVCTFAVLFLLTTIILRAIVFALNVVNGIPVFGLANRLAGGVMGIFCSLLVVWFLFMIVVVLYSTEIGKMIYETICGNDYTRILFDNNPLLNISIKF